MANAEPGDLAARIAAVIKDAGAPAVAKAALAHLSDDQKTELLNKTDAASPAQARTPAFWQLPPSGPGGARPGQVCKPENSKQDTYGGVAAREHAAVDREHAGIDDEPAGVKQSAPAHVRQVPITSDNSMAIDDDSMAVDGKSAPICAKNTLASSWTGIVDRFDRTQRPPGIPPHRWRGFVGDCYAFLRSGWAAKAADRGWTAPDLFTFPRQWDSSVGLLWVINSGTLVELHGDWAEIKAAGSSRPRIFDRPSINTSKRRDPLHGTPMMTKAIEDDY
jgi:hypothetical protein